MLFRSITQPPTINITATSVPVSCNAGNNGSINITVTGGTPAYTFQWSNGAQTEDINNLTAGMYTVTVTDANGCTKTLVQSVAQPSAITLSIAMNIACDGATDINLSVSGGTTSCGIPAYTYQWSNGATSQDLIGVDNCQTYTVTVTDCNDCVKITSVTVPCVTEMNLTTNVVSASCHGVCDGSIDLSVTGGFGGYTYFWSNNATTQDLSNVCSGIFVVTVTDSHGCKKSRTVVVSQPTDRDSVEAPTPRQRRQACNHTTI